MTGGGFGYCGSGRRPGYGLGGLGPGRGRRLGRGMGPGYGYGRAMGSYRWPRILDANAELAELQREAEDVKGYLKDLEARMAELRQPSA